jgi:hypothetical protein
LNVTKTLVSYLGGSAGDMITASLNMIELSFVDKVYVTTNNFSIKDQQLDNITDIGKFLAQTPMTYISTHAFDLILDSTLNWMSLQVTDPDVSHICILRQMQLQRLRIKSDPNSTWYKIVSGLCKKKKYYNAANFWFKKSYDHWMSDMQYRIQVDARVPKSFCLDHLFTNKFVSEWEKKMPEFDLSMLKANHACWLEKNQPAQWTMQSTICTMAEKLSLMEWNQPEGTIICHA